VLAGREPILEAFTVVRRKVDELGEGDRGWILNGLRGVGKTVLLNELLAQVTDKGWIAAKVEVTPAIPLPVALSSALVRAMRAATGRHPEPRLRRLLGVFKAFSLKFDPASGMVSVGVDVEPLAGVADTGRFADDLAMLFEVLGETSRDLGIGTLILVDELQEASAADLTAVNTAVHQIGQSDRPLPLTFVGAGLPSVNTLVLREGRLEGFSTDAAILAGLQAERPVIVGDGGAAAAFLQALPKAQVFSRRSAWPPHVGDADLVVNATPVRDEVLLELNPGQTLVDLPYPRSATADAAARAGARVLDGLEVLVAQGAASFELWTGVSAPVPVMRRALGLPA